MIDVLLMNIIDLIISWVDHPSDLQWTSNYIHRCKTITTTVLWYHTNDRFRKNNFDSTGFYSHFWTDWSIQYDSLQYYTPWLEVSNAEHAVKFCTHTLL